MKTIHQVHAQDFVGAMFDKLGLTMVTLVLYKPHPNLGSEAGDLSDEPRVDHWIDITLEEKSRWVIDTMYNPVRPPINDEEDPWDVYKVDTNRWATMMSHFIGLLQVDVKDKGYVIGLSSKVEGHDLNPKQLLFFDMEGRFYCRQQVEDCMPWTFHHVAMKDHGFGVVDSGRSHHIYTQCLLTDDEWAKALNATTLSKPGTGLEVDHRWAARAIHHGMATIRLTGNDKTAKPKDPRGNTYFGGFMKPAPWMPRASEEFEPDTDLPF